MGHSSFVSYGFLSRLVNGGKHVITKKGGSESLGLAGVLCTTDGPDKIILIYTFDPPRDSYRIQRINLAEVAVVACIRHGDTIMPEGAEEKVLSDLGKVEVRASSELVLGLFGPPSWIGYTPTDRTNTSVRIGSDAANVAMLQERPEFFYGQAMKDSTDMNQASGGYHGWCERVKIAGGTVAGALSLGDEQAYAKLARVQMREAVVEIIDDVKDGNVVWVYGHGDFFPFVVNDPKKTACPLSSAGVIVCLINLKTREVLATIVMACPLNN